MTPEQKKERIKEINEEIKMGRDERRASMREYRILLREKYKLTGKY